MPNVAFTVFVPESGLPFISFLHRRQDLAWVAAHRGTAERAPGEPSSACEALLDGIFADGNGMGEGDGFTVAGRSMCVGDIVTVDGCGTWVHAGEGWQQLPAEEAERFALDAETCPPHTVDRERFASEYQPAYPLPSGLMVYVRRSDIGREVAEAAGVAVAGECRITGDFFVLENVSLEGLSAWYDDGIAIQDALPGLSPLERKFIKSAIRPGAFAPA